MRQQLKLSIQSVSIDSAMLPLSAAEINGSSFESIGGIYSEPVLWQASMHQPEIRRMQKNSSVLFGTEVERITEDGFPSEAAVLTSGAVWRNQSVSL